MDVLISRRRAGWFVFAFCFLVYLLTLCPTVSWDDSGELISACYTLGIPHPPGQPLYAILGKLFTLIPLGSIAWRVNFMSAFFGALSSLLVYKIIYEILDEGPWKSAAALGGALFFAFAPTVWEQATIAETTTLHCFFMMLLTLFAFRLASGKVFFESQTKSLYLFGFLYGLSLTNHVAGVFFFPSFVYIFIRTFGKRIFTPRLLGGMLAFSLLGLLVYAYLPIRSLSNPPIDWGNPENLESFISVITAEQYAGGLIVKPNVFEISAYLALRARDLLHQFTLVGCAFGLVGAAALYRRDKRFIIFSLLVSGIILFICMSSAFISAYFVPFIALLAVWIGAGIRQILIWIEYHSEKIRSASMTKIIKYAFSSLVTAGFLLPLGIYFKDMDRSDDPYTLHHAEKLLERLPEGSILFATKEHNLFPLWYLIHCENRRPDLMVLSAFWLLLDDWELDINMLDQYPELKLPPPETVAAYASRAEDAASKRFLIIQSVMDENYSRHPIFWGEVSGDLPFSQNLVPLGMVYQYSPNPVMMDDETVAENRQFWESALDSMRKNPAMKKDKIALKIFPRNLNNLGLMFERAGRDDLSMWATKIALEFNPEYPVGRYNLGRLEALAGNYEKAVKEYKLAIQADPHMASAHYSLGNAYVKLRRFDSAFLAYRKAIDINESYHEAITAMGRLYMLVGQNEDAIEKFQRALVIEPQYVFAIRGLASAYVETGLFDEAKGMLDRALAIEPESAPTLLTLAKYYAGTGDQEQSANALMRCIEIGGDTYRDIALSDEKLKKLAEEISSSTISPEPRT